MAKIYLKANLPNLLDMTAREVKVTGISIGFQVALAYLQKITKRAMEIKDKVILANLNQIGMLSDVTEEEEKEFNDLLSKQ